MGGVILALWNEGLGQSDDLGCCGLYCRVRGRRGLAGLDGYVRSVSCGFGGNGWNVVGGRVGYGGCGLAHRARHRDSDGCGSCAAALRAVFGRHLEAGGRVVCVGCWVRSWGLDRGDLGGDCCVSCGAHVDVGCFIGRGGLVRIGGLLVIAMRRHARHGGIDAVQRCEAWELGIVGVDGRGLCAGSRDRVVVVSRD